MGGGWSVDEVYTVIAFLDVLRDQLWETYGDEIIEMLQAADNGSVDEQQTELAFDDDLDVYTTGIAALIRYVE